MVIFCDENASIMEPRLSAENLKCVSSKLKVDPPYGELNRNFLRRKHIDYQAQAVGGKFQMR